jgi:hypothetical protein
MSINTLLKLSNRKTTINMSLLFSTFKFIIWCHFSIHRSHCSIININWNLWVNTVELNIGNRDTQETPAFSTGTKDTSHWEIWSEPISPSNSGFLMSDLEIQVIHFLRRAKLINVWWWLREHNQYWYLADVN